jgi:hypothetical protein
MHKSAETWLQEVAHKIQITLANGLNEACLKASGDLN